MKLEKLIDKPSCIIEIPYGIPDRNHNILTKEALLNALKKEGIEPIEIKSTSIIVDIQVRFDNGIQEIIDKGCGVK